MNLRPYQQEAHDAAVNWLRSSTEPCLIEAATGAGKSLIISALAGTLLEKSRGKRVLCLQPSKELLEQNFEKYIRSGGDASVFSASVGTTSLRFPVIYGTPVSVKNKIHRFGADFCAVILDEAHINTPTIRHIVDDLRAKNPLLRVVGMTATPYRMGSGYIYAVDDRGRRLSAGYARDPYYAKLVYRIDARALIGMGYLTQPVISDIGQDHYDTINLALNSRGQFDAADIDQAYHGHGRKTAHIVADVVARSAGRQGVMFFASTVRHAEEVRASLPPSMSAIITGATPKQQREAILRDFKGRRLKYVVNVSVLCVGFDAPHVDVIALLRATESVSLLQQMVGRGLRISEGKEDCLVLDYAQNLERHCPDGDIFAPTVKASAGASGGSEIEAQCEECATVNLFSARKNEDGFEIDAHGYFVDLNGARVPTKYGFMPAHYGRRCLGETKSGQCTYRWTYKKCTECDAENDIAARYCADCKSELIDPNEKLKANFIRHKSDPTEVQTDEILGYQAIETLSRAGNEMIRLEISTPYRTFCVFVMKTPKTADQRKALALLEQVEYSPQTVTYRKDPDSGFYRILGFDEPCEKEPCEV